MTNKEVFQELFPEDEYNIYHGYSGRFMYGEKTEGVIANHGEVVDIELKLRQAQIPFSIDQFGMQYIIYIRLPELENKARKDILDELRSSSSQT